MEYLSRCLTALKNDSRFGFHLKCKRTLTIELLFANDLLIFYKGAVGSVSAIKEQLDKFSTSSGLQPNRGKSAIYLCGVDEAMVDIICLCGSYPLDIWVFLSHTKS